MVRYTHGSARGCGMLSRCVGRQTMVAAMTMKKWSDTPGGCWYRQLDVRQIGRQSQESHHSACPQTTTPWNVRHCLEVTIWDGPLQVEGDPSAHPWKPAAAKWSLITSAGAPPYSHRVRSITPRNLVRRKTADEAARQ